MALADKATIKTGGISSLDLMERAAFECFQWIKQRIKPNDFKIHIFCGIGNNGGDGLVITRYLLENNYNISCYIVNFSKKRSEDFLTNYERVKAIGDWPKVISNENEFPEINKNDFIIDAIFGNGLSRPPIGFVKNLIKYINQKEPFTLAIDMPSGLYTNQTVEDQNQVLKANHILTFQYPKLALLLPENKNFIATWEIIDIGLDTKYVESLHPENHYITQKDILPLYKHRKKWEHKGNFGHSLLIGGSYGKIGAIILASKAALKVGSGLVSAYIPKCGYPIMQTAIPEVMVEVDKDDFLTYFNFKTKATVIGIGPGMGTDEKTIKGFEKFIQENNIPLVIDADAINLLSKNRKLLKFLPDNTVITPHPKELERLLGTWKNDYDKLKKAQHFTRENNCILVLKDAITAIVTKNATYFNSTGNPALATAGSGDVLTGIITGLIAQKYAPLHAAIFGVYLHGLTADLGSLVEGYESFTASSILNYLPDAFISLFEKPTDTSSTEQ
jgi:hydroxyethylthiazole kinase-like uncharacterized protein yjeF